MNENNEYGSSGNEPSGFGLPGDYFQNAASSIQNKIEWEEEMKSYGNLLRLRNKKIFSVPDTYFSQNESKLELIIYPGLAGKPKDSGFGVPEDYFVQNAFRIKDILIPEKKQVKVRPLFKPGSVYALAAMLVIVLGVWIYSLSTKTQVADCQTLACIERGELLNTNQLENFENDDLYDIVNIEKLNKNLNIEVKLTNTSDDTLKNEYDLIDEI